MLFTHEVSLTSGGVNNMGNACIWAPVHPHVKREELLPEEILSECMVQFTCNRLTEPFIYNHHLTKYL